MFHCHHTLYIPRHSLHSANPPPPPFCVDICTDKCMYESIGKKTVSPKSGGCLGHAVTIVETRSFPATSPRCPQCPCRGSNSHNAAPKASNAIGYVIHSATATAPTRSKIIPSQNNTIYYCEGHVSDRLIMTTSFSVQLGNNLLLSRRFHLL